jgi:hypothetical protein
VVALCLTPTPAAAQPVIAGFAVTPDRGHVECHLRTACLRLTLRVFDGSRLRGSKLNVRFVARHVDETGLRMNMVGSVPNEPGIHRMWVTSPRGFRRGTYLARVIVTGSSATKSPARTFVWR